MVWPLASEPFVRGDKWLCTREGAAGIQGCAGGSPGASLGCWLGSGRRGEPGQRLVEELSPVHPPPLARWGTGGLRKWEVQFVWFFGSELPAGGLVQRQTRAGPWAWQGSGSRCSRPPRLLLPFSPAAVGLCRHGAAEALQNTLQTESRSVVNDGPSTLQGLIK